VSTFSLLLVENDSDLRERLSQGLSQAGFDVHATSDATTAMRPAERAPDAMVIDVDLPDGDGRELSRALRARGVSAPALFLVPGDTASAPLSSIGGEADDYVTEPFGLPEVVARVRALLRSARSTSPTSFGTVRLDPVMHAVSGESGAVSLTPTEYRVLSALAEGRGGIVRRQELVRAGWPEGAIVHDNTLDQYITRLRSKLRKVTVGTAIVTTRGVGYRLQ
jgi:DNA-binding response OmpR family regulator